MNILIYNFNEPYPRQGGMERVTDMLARQLKKNGHEVYLLCNYKNRLDAVYESVVPIYFLPIPHKQSASSNKKFVKSLIVDKKIRCIIDQAEGGVVGRFGIFKKKNDFVYDVKLVAVLHSSALSHINNLPILLNSACWERISSISFGVLFNMYVYIKKKRAIRLRRFLYKRLNADYDAIVMLSRKFWPEFKYFCPKVDENKLWAIPNFNVYENICLPKIKSKTVLFVGRLHNLSKGVDRLLEIWSRVYFKHPDWNLKIVGDGPDRSQLEKMAADLSLDNISFEGFQSPGPYYEEAQIFCMTSTFEGFGMVLTEAMQHGNVPLAFQSYSSITDIVDDEVDGYLIKPFDIEEYASRLDELMGNEKLRMLMSLKCISDVKKFDVYNIMGLWNHLIDQM